ncbi:hypothetical protein [Fibrobacter sp. UWB11]|uniref:hypothetical protein n=1 Tax=Fibrobacter sp. UWB11 TaxID=1896202 RepID=UPI000927B2FF|nr:hypothetical protein [Fibrobacter sp. UWB11]SIO29743.1 hypothetical protein SAMN05720758_2080 [Fibrobacter sp. UWB11]
MLDGKFLIPATIGVLGTFIGALIGALSAHWLYHKNKKSEERRIINESIHYLLEVFFLVNRLNADKMADAYLDYYFKRIKEIIPALNEKTIDSAKKQYGPMINNSLFFRQKENFENLNKLKEQYEKMIANLATILPIDAYYLRGKNDLENWMQSISEYFENVKNTDVKDSVAKETINQIQSSLTKELIDEYQSELKTVLFALLSKTNWSTRRAGKKVVKGIESTDLTENEKRKVDKEIKNIVNLILQNTMKYGSQNK